LPGDGRLRARPSSPTRRASDLGAVRRYLEGEGARAPSFDLRAAVPINLRKLEKMAELGNRFGLVFVPLPLAIEDPVERVAEVRRDRKSTRLNSSHVKISYAVFC